MSAPQGSRLTLEAGQRSETVELYSAEGRDLVAALWLKLCAEYRVMYEPSWMGIPVIQLAEDIVMMQELVWKVRPDLIVESGLAHGGSAVFYAALCELMGKGRVIGIDVEVRQHNRVALESHPMGHRIDIVEGSSVDPAVVEAVRVRARNAGKVMVVLDSDHSRSHVLAELNAYHDIVSPGSYLVAMDGAQGMVWDIPRGNPSWQDDNPLPAIAEFLLAHPEFAIDPHFTRLHVTSNPNGYLRRAIAAEPPG